MWKCDKTPFSPLLLSLLSWLSQQQKEEENWDERATVYLLLKWSRNFKASKAFPIETFGSRANVNVYWNITANMYAVTKRNFNRSNQAIHHSEHFARFLSYFRKLLHPFPSLMWQRKVHFKLERKKSLQKCHIPSLSSTGAFRFQSGKCWKLIIIFNPTFFVKRCVSDNCY